MTGILSVPLTSELEVNDLAFLTPKRKSVFELCDAGLEDRVNIRPAQNVRGETGGAMVRERPVTLRHRGNILYCRIL